MEPVVLGPVPEQVVPAVALAALAAVAAVALAAAVLADPSCRSGTK